ncbi:MAG: uroporphyrinogen-III synthase [Bacteroidota bacterium]|nr:uroporphyrinogen-III synthase [Bacteroidota bacterium]MDP4211657.1 uroporphyrinogen-III synthase [Bacteroidota bacterium]MDP4251172.1 uroporphyrinogen-III synthase [Bacteroidota bacterium]
MPEIVVKKILITQPRPESDKSPYFDLARRHNVELAFLPFIRLEGIASKDFRRQKVEIGNYTAVVFTSRHAIDHFFRTAEEMKINVSQDTKYFCVTEAVALYLQKFILYRKRKVFYGADGTNKSMLEVINKHKENEKFLYPTSEYQQDNEIVNWLKSNHCEFATPYMYRTISNDIKESFSKEAFDIICFFTPSGVKSLFDNFPEFKQNGTLIGAFGNNTSRAAEEAGLVLEIKAPQPMAPSMISALEKYLSDAKKR